MPVACSTSTLTGQDGSVFFKPAGTTACLMDAADFPAGTQINLPVQHDFKAGDPVVFAIEGAATLDTALVEGTTYYITSVSADKATISATKGGNPITLNGDGGFEGGGGEITAADTSGLTLPTTSGAYGAGPYVGVPLSTDNEGVGATATVTIVTTPASGGEVQTITTTSLPTTTGNYGAGPYTGIATTTSGGGTGATLDVTVTANDVTAVAVNAGGAGYAVGETLTVDGALLGGASGTDDLTLPIATATAIVPAASNVTAITMVDAGTLFEAGDTLTIPGTALGGNSPADDLAFAVGAANAITRVDSAGHVNLTYSEFEAVCNVSMFDLSMTRARIDTTSLKCNFDGAAAKYAPFRTYQSGFADGTGSMTVKFSRDQASLANRMLQNSLLRVQDGAMARLFIDTVTGAAGIDLTASNYIEVALSIEGMDLSVSTDDSPIEASLNFSFQGQPSHLFYTTLN